MASQNPQPTCPAYLPAPATDNCSCVVFPLRYSTSFNGEARASRTRAALASRALEDIEPGKAVSTCSPIQPCSPGKIPDHSRQLLAEAAPQRYPYVSAGARAVFQCSARAAYQVVLQQKAQEHNAEALRSNFIQNREELGSLSSHYLIFCGSLSLHSTETRDPRACTRLLRGSLGKGLCCEQRMPVVRPAINSR